MKKGYVFIGRRIKTTPYGTTEPWCHRTMVPQNHGTTEPWGPQNHGATEPKNIYK